MTEKAASDQGHERRASAVKQVLASSRRDGVRHSPEFEANLPRYIDGEITAAELGSSARP